MITEVEKLHQQVEALKARLASQDPTQVTWHETAMAFGEIVDAQAQEIEALRAENAGYHKLLLDVDRCAPYDLDQIQYDDFRWAVEAVRREMES